MFHTCNHPYVSSSSQIYIFMLVSQLTEEDKNLINNWRKYKAVENIFQTNLQADKWSMSSASLVGTVQRNVYSGNG